MDTVTTAWLAEKTSKSERQIRRTLTQCEAAGLVERIDKRGGWRLTKAGLAMITPASAETIPNPAAAPSSTSGGAGEL